MDWLLDTVRLHPAAVGAVIFWIATPGLIALHIKALRERRFKTRFDGVVRADKDPRLFRRYAMLMQALIGSIVILATVMTVIALEITW